MIIAVNFQFKQLEIKKPEKKKFRANLPPKCFIEIILFQEKKTKRNSLHNKLKSSADKENEESKANYLSFGVILRKIA